MKKILLYLFVLFAAGVQSQTPGNIIAKSLQFKPRNLAFSATAPDSNYLYIDAQGYVKRTTGASGGSSSATINYVGDEINYSFATNPLSSFSVSGTAPTTNGSNTTINGTTTLTWPVQGQGAINYKYSFSFVTNVKTSAAQYIGVEITPNYYPQYFTRWLECKMEDTAGYLKYYTDDTRTNYFSNRGTRTFNWSAGDTIDVSVYSAYDDISFQMRNRANGQISSLSLGKLNNLNNASNIAQLKIVASGNFKLIGSLKYTILEKRTPDFLIVGNSIEAGSSATSINYRWQDVAFKEYSNSYVTTAGSYERSAEGILRIPEIVNVIRPTRVLYCYGVNDVLTGVTSVTYAANVRQFVDSMQAHSIVPVLVSVSPQATSVVAYNDSLQAIATRNGLLYIDVYSVLKAASGTDRNSLYNSDGIHFNNMGHAVWGQKVQKELAPVLTLNTETKYDLRYTDKYRALVAFTDSNTFVKADPASISWYIGNRKFRDAAGFAQAGEDKHINIVGDLVTLGYTNKILLAGTSANPQFSINRDGDNYIRISGNTIINGFFNILSGQGVMDGAYILHINGHYTRGINQSVKWTSSAVGASNIGLEYSTESAAAAGFKMLSMQDNSVEKLSINKDGKISIDATITAGGTTGNQTINKPTGTVNIAAGGTTVTVTNSQCTTSSIVWAVIRTNDATAIIKNVVPGAGSFVITLSAAATAEVSIGFIVFN